MASWDQPGSLSQLFEEVAEEEFELGVACNGDVEARLWLGRVGGELCSGEVPVQLDLLVMVVGQVDGFGTGSGSE